jgi:hypothetical protein
MIDAKDSNGVAPSTLHAHTCSECFKLRTCYVQPCPARHNPGVLWICFECVGTVEEVHHANV